MGVGRQPHQRCSPCWHHPTCGACARGPRRPPLQRLLRALRLRRHPPRLQRPLQRVRQRQRPRCPPLLLPLQRYDHCAEPGPCVQRVCVSGRARVHGGGMVCGVRRWCAGMQKRGAHSARPRPAIASPPPPLPRSNAREVCSPNGLILPLQPRHLRAQQRLQLHRGARQQRLQLGLALQRVGYRLGRRHSRGGHGDAQTMRAKQRPRVALGCSGRALQGRREKCVHQRLECVLCTCYKQS